MDSSGKKAKASPNAFKTKHPSRQAKWTGLDIPAPMMEKIETIVGYLSSADIEALGSIIGMFSHRAHGDVITKAEVRKNLHAIACLSKSSDLNRAYANCDAWTKAALDAASVEIDGMSLKQAKPAKIEAAALLALKRMPSDKGGRPAVGWRRLLAKQVLHVCQSRGLGNSCSFGETVSPSVTLLMLLLKMVDPKAPRDESAAAKLLLEVRAHTEFPQNAL